MPNKRTFLVGQTLPSNRCGNFRITKRLANRKFRIRFIDTGTVVEAHGPNIRTGAVNDPYHPTVCGVGFLGEFWREGKHHPLYSVWMSMLHRCYDAKVQARQPTYVGCTVEKRWHNFGLFVEDVEPLLDRAPEGYQFDKDWIILGSKEYSRKTCSFVPKELNVARTATREIRQAKNGYTVAVGQLRKRVRDKRSAQKLLHKMRYFYLKALCKSHVETLDPRVTRTLKRIIRQHKEQALAA